MSTRVTKKKTDLPWRFLSGALSWLFYKLFQSIRIFFSRKDQKRTSLSKYYQSQNVKKKQKKTQNVIIPTRVTKNKTDLSACFDFSFYRPLLTISQTSSSLDFHQNIKTYFPLSQKYHRRVQNSEWGSQKRNFLKFLCVLWMTRSHAKKIKKRVKWGRKWLQIRFLLLLE